ncbi:MAG: helix-turn-helix domain-containing protein [Xanthobacteraceae bacterium]|nr:helix-turn-helix domain-containing protein [Xanthobacteraceae bacterium]
MARHSADGSRAGAAAKVSPTDKGDAGSSPRLRGLDSNPQGVFGPQFWQAFRSSVVHLYTLSLPDASEEARFTVATRTYPTPRAILMHCRGTAFTMTRGPALVARGVDQVLIMLQREGTCTSDVGGRHVRIEPGDVVILDYARPFRSAVTDYGNLMIILAREAVPAALLATEPHGLVFPRESGAARLIGAALQEFYARADDLTVSEAEAAIEGVVALTTAFARARLADDEADHVKSKRKAALDCIDANLGNEQLGPDEIAEAAGVSRASLYRLLAAEGGIRTVLLKRRLEQALRLMLADNNDERSLMDIAKCCGFGGTSQFSRAFRARFGAPPRQYLALVRQQDLDWLEARMTADGFEQDAFMWRQQGLSKSAAHGTWHAPVPAAKSSGVPD